MTTDALDPGPDGTYPHLPRNPDGTLDTVRMPVGPRHQRDRHSNLVLIDVEPTAPDGRRVSDIAPLPTEG
jgi:hypothetical protein